MLGPFFCKENVQNFAGHPFQTEDPRTCLSISKDSSIAITAPYPDINSLSCQYSNSEGDTNIHLSDFTTFGLGFRV